MSAAALLVLLPLAGALLLAALPAQAARLNVLVSAVTLGVAIWLAATLPGGEGWLRAEPLPVTLALVAAVVGFGTALFSWQDVAGEGFDLARTRAYHAGFQGFMAAQFLALLSDNLGVMWVA
nr:hydrogenase 4 subunit F [Rubritepida sp.]